MASVGHTKRLSRIKGRAIPAVQEAYENGLISAKRADLLLYLSPSKQAERLCELLRDREAKERRHKAAAQTIEAYLQSHKGKPDLQELAAQIRAAIL
jgi:hypothetical protein